MSSSDDKIMEIGIDLKDVNGSRIYYEKPSIDQIRKNGNPLNLKLSDVSGKKVYTINCYVENLKKAWKGIYYGPFPILTSGRTSEIKCYFSETWCKNLHKWCEIAKTFQKYIVTESASTQCDLSFVPTRQQTDSEPSSSSTLLDPKVDKFVQEIGIIKLETCELDKQHNLQEKDVRYVMPLKEEMDKCSLDEAFPLQCFGDYGSYMIIPCFTSKSQKFPSGTNHDVYTIQLINPNGSVTTMRCYIPHVEYLLESQNVLEKRLRRETCLDDRFKMNLNYLGRCNYTIYKKNGSTEKKSFEYAVPKHEDVVNGQNPYQLEVLFGSTSEFATVYIGDFKSFDRNKYIGPYLIEEIKTDGTRRWLNCYFKKDSFSQENERSINHRVQELFLKKDEYESQKNVFLGTDHNKYDTEVSKSKIEEFGLVHVLRTIKEYDMTRDVLSGSEI